VGDVNVAEQNMNIHKPW